MDLTFLEAECPLTKTFDIDDGNIATTPYPFVKNFTSHVECVTDHLQFSEALHRHAELGHCLLKGNLSSPLNHESRANKTDSVEPTHYLCLDLDFSEAFFGGSVESFLNAIGIEGVSAVWQKSASAGVKYPAETLRGHCFVRLETPVAPNLLKAWLMDLNLTIPSLREQITLSANRRGLKWPLDITTCQNDKLIYIAPPFIFNHGELVDDPLAGQRIFTLDREYEAWRFPGVDKDYDTIHNAADLHIDLLREQAGYPKSKPKYKTVGQAQVLTNPGRAAITGVKTARGYTYLNLNGGDSWGYYFPENSPDVLYNFKGEPPVSLKMLNYEFWKAQRPEQNLLEAQPLVFLNQTQTQYYACIKWSDDTVQLTPLGSKELIQNFRGLHALPLDDFIPIWNVVFDPTTTEQIMMEKQWVNTYHPPHFAKILPAPNATLADTPIIQRIIHNVLANDSACVDRFINWLAYIFQNKTKTGTTWLLHGIEGTGKGLLFSKIITPLFGADYCLSITDDSIREKFNEYRHQKLFILIDEINLENGSSRAGDSNANNKLKSLITESETSIRAMRVSPVRTTCYDNILLASNDRTPITITENNRRVNVPPRSETKLEITPQEIAHDLPAELEPFAAFLAGYPADEILARTLINTEAAQQLVEQSVQSTERYTAAILKGDLTPFLEELKTHWIDEAGTPRQPSGLENPAYRAYDRVIRRVAKEIIAEGTMTMTKDDFASIFTFLRDESMSPAKLNKFLRMANIPLHRLRFNGSQPIAYRHAQPTPLLPENIPDSPFPLATVHPLKTA